jgi:hypothetical protein
VDLLSRRQRHRRRAFQLESVFLLGITRLTIRTAIILTPIIGAITGPVCTWDLATIGITAAAYFITAGTGKTISRNFYELAGYPKPAHFVSRLGAPVAAPRTLKSLVARTC